MDWFTADLHLDHANIIKHCNRPFDSVEQMNHQLIANINMCVKAQDTLFILGDFAWKNAAYFLDCIKCSDIWFVTGNHDECFPARHPKVRWQGDILPWRFDGQDVVMCHYPMMTWDGSYHGSWHLFGHEHGRLIHPSRRALDVGVDAWGYAPVSWETIVNTIHDGLDEERSKISANLPKKGK